MCKDTLASHPNRMFTLVDPLKYIYVNCHSARVVGWYRMILYHMIISISRNRIKEYTLHLEIQHLSTHNYYLSLTAVLIVNHATE